MFLACRDRDLPDLPTGCRSVFPGVVVEPLNGCALDLRRFLVQPYKKRRARMAKIITVRGIIEPADAGRCLEAFKSLAT